MDLHIEPYVNLSIVKQWCNHGIFQSWLETSNPVTFKQNNKWI